MSSFSRVAGLLLAVAAIGLAGCGGKQGGAAAPAASDIQVTTTVVQPVAWSDTVRALGTAHARESVTLTAKVSEIVDQVHFESGQHVQAGQPLVTLRVDAQEAALGEAEATLAEAEEQYRRLEGLAGQKLVARSHRLQHRQAQGEGLSLDRRGGQAAATPGRTVGLGIHGHHFTVPRGHAQRGDGEFRRAGENDPHRSSGSSGRATRTSRPRVGAYAGGSRETSGARPRGGRTDLVQAAWRRCLTSFLRTISRLSGDR